MVGRPDIAARSLRFLCGLPSIFDAPVYGVDGTPVPDEREVPGVCEYDGSAPIRAGNAAKGQQQYDALGVVVEAVSVFVQHGGRLDAELWRLVVSICDRMCQPPHERTNGIWEVREPRPLVSADIGRWLALDRAVWLGRFLRPSTGRRRWIETRRAVRERVLSELRADGRIPQEYAGDPDRLDASALLVPIFGMLHRRDARASRLIDAHIERLGDGPFLNRYAPDESDGFTGREAAFVPCSWWAVAALAAVGRVEEAEARADALCRALPPLVAEQFDPCDHVNRGNIPLVWSHMEAARALRFVDVARTRQRGGAPLLALSRAAAFVRGRITDSAS
jgi:GH15 family glucan-1,4-alpha-glucosidase